MSVQLDPRIQEPRPQALARLGHVHLKVRDAQRSAEFYRMLFDLKITEQVGQHFVFLSSNQSHHELALQSLGSSAQKPGANAMGLYHTAWEVSSTQALAEVWDRLARPGHALVAVDHGISWALYFDDPDGNGVEVYLDRRSAPNGSATWNGQSRNLVRAELRESEVEPPR